MYELLTSIKLAMSFGLLGPTHNKTSFDRKKLKRKKKKEKKLIITFITIITVISLFKNRQSNRSRIFNNDVVYDTFIVVF
jgi:hypothetical protein